MGVIDYVLGVLLILFSLAIIVVVLMQQGRRKGISGTIAGGADTFLSRGQAKKFDAALPRWTKYIAIAFFILVLIVNILSVVLK